MWTFLSRTALLTLVTGSALAATAAPARKPAEAPETRAAVVTQADGITNRVVDNLWIASDLYWHRGDYNRVISLIRVCVEADPGFTEAWSSAGWLLWSMGDTPGADAFLKYGVAHSPDKGGLEYNLGWHLFNTKRYDAALPYLEAATKHSDAPSIAWKTLGHCYERLGRLDDSLAAWKTVVARYPEDKAGPVNLRRLEARVNAKKEQR